MNPDKMKLPDDKAIQSVGQIASHNTYEHGGDWYSEKNDWRSNLDWVDAVELDVWPSKDWLVAHHGHSGGHLEAYIQNLADWRKKPENLNHDLITVFIEIKSGAGWRVGDFESCLVDHGLARSDMYKPLDLAAWAKSRGFAGLTLRDLVKAHGWPTFKEVKNKIMFVVNGVDHALYTYFDERPLVSGSQWNTDQSTQPVCFVMTSWTDLRRDYQSVVFLNDTYNGWPDPSAVSAGDRNAYDLAKNCLWRAYDVKDGNAEMVGDPKDLTVATKLMKNKKINYLAYDDTKNAFWTSLT
jgi:hypothetical protein